MTDEMEQLLRCFRPVGPPTRLREKILRQEVARAVPIRHWPIWVFRSAVAAALLVSFITILAADRLNRDTAACIGVGPVRWTAEAQQAADLLGSGPASRQYIAICLMAGNGHAPHNLLAQGEGR